MTYICIITFAVYKGECFALSLAIDKSIGGGGGGGESWRRISLWRCEKGYSHRAGRATRRYFYTIYNI